MKNSDILIYRNIQKRYIDLITAIILLLLLSPFAFLIALMIKLEDGCPILYISKRVGQDGILFNFYKFRSMHVDADINKKHLSHLQE
jgi:lipopolysaccharide/colanic/teichoic acid biosynthesis glycosyltransferase